MASSRKSTNSKSNDILHIGVIIFLVIIICIIIYLIYKTLKGKGEFFEIVKTIEHYEMKLNTDATLDQYKESEKSFQTDLKKDITSYDTSYSAANDAYNKYNTDYTSISVSVKDLQKSLDTVNSTISSINSQISTPTTENVTSAKSSLDALVTSLGPIQTDATAKKTLATDLQTRGTTVNTLLQTAYGNANIVINDINEGNKIRDAFTNNYVKTFIQPKITAAESALKTINITGKTDVENQIITTSKAKLGDTIKNINAVVETAKTQLDHSKYISQRDSISAQQKIVDTNKTTLGTYITALAGIITSIQTIQDTCQSYQTNLPKIGDALNNMSQVILNYNDLLKFNSDILALQPTQ